DMAVAASRADADLACALAQLAHTDVETGRSGRTNTLLHALTARNRSRRWAASNGGSSWREGPGQGGRRSWVISPRQRTRAWATASVGRDRVREASAGATRRSELLRAWR